jgi:putative RNA 2'-phosphotransferase
MNEERKKKISKNLSYWLRHNPGDIGIELGDDGWVDVKELLDKSKAKLVFDFNELKEVVQTNDKQRFSLSEDFCSIRANQGHTTDVNIKFNEVVPPSILYHGTPDHAVPSIMKEGISKMKRHHVHLSPDKDTASIVGSRRGKFTILEIEAMRMRADGHKFYISDNGVYLVDEVPSKYIIKK